MTLEKTPNRLAYTPSSAHGGIAGPHKVAHYLVMRLADPNRGHISGPKWRGEQVELKIVERASDNTIGRTLKKYAQACCSRPWRAGGM